MVNHRLYQTFCRHPVQRYILVHELICLDYRIRLLIDRRHKQDTQPPTYIKVEFPYNITELQLLKDIHPTHVAFRDTRDVYTRESSASLSEIVAKESTDTSHSLSYRECSHKHRL